MMGDTLHSLGLLLKHTTTLKELSLEGAGSNLLALFLGQNSTITKLKIGMHYQTQKMNNWVVANTDISGLHFPVMLNHNTCLQELIVRDLQFEFQQYLWQALKFNTVITKCEYYGKQCM